MLSREPNSPMRYPHYDPFAQAFPHSGQCHCCHISTHNPHIVRTTLESVPWRECKLYSLLKCPLGATDCHRSADPKPTAGPSVTHLWPHVIWALWSTRGVKTWTQHSPRPTHNKFCRELDYDFERNNICFKQSSKEPVLQKTSTGCSKLMGWPSKTPICHLRSHNKAKGLVT